MIITKKIKNIWTETNQGTLFFVNSLALHWYHHKLLLKNNSINDLEDKWACELWLTISLLRVKTC